MVKLTLLCFVFSITVMVFVSPAQSTSNSTTTTTTTTPTISPDLTTITTTTPNPLEKCFLKLWPREDLRGYKRYDEATQKWVTDESAFYQVGGADPGFHGASLPTHPQGSSYWQNPPNGFKDLSELPGMFKMFFQWPTSFIKSISIMGPCTWTLYNEVNYGGARSTQTGPKDLMRTQDFGWGPKARQRLQSIKFHSVEAKPPHYSPDRF